MMSTRTRKQIAVLTSGGDAPGMNACLRSVARTAAQRGHPTIGIQRGFQGLISDQRKPLGPRSVSNILQRGGTLLHTARCDEMRTESGLRKAATTLKKIGADALIVIGGDGSFRGACDLSRHWSGQMIGVPATIDNDLAGTDFTIGFDTAVSTAVDAIDKLRDTADAHERIFLVEVMGRDSGLIALTVGITAGAEEIFVPEETVDFSEACERLCSGRRAGKTSSIIVVAEGALEGGAYAASDKLKKLSDNEYRVCVLGHLQRGGSPTPTDRLLASKLGAYAVEAIDRGESSVMIGETAGELEVTALEKSWKGHKALAASLKALFKTLAT